MRQKQSADKKLKAILDIHKRLRMGDEVKGEELAVLCQTSERTIVNYVAFMRETLKAPIISSRYYGYKYNPDKPYSLLAGLDDTELGTLNELLAVVRQLQNTKELRGMERVLLALEQQIGVVRANPNPLISFEEAELVGRDYLDKLYRLIHQKKFIKIKYQGFDMEQSVTKLLFPLQLREFNNRWYLIAWGEFETRMIIQNIPLDRIQQEPNETSEAFTYPPHFAINTYFQDLIGVTKTGNLQTVRLKFHSRKRANYVITKKLHHSQTLPVSNEDGTIELSIRVEINNELTAKILEFGADVEVLEPPTLRQAIAAILQQATLLYHEAKSVV